jgi:DNA gyrase subunit B
MGEAEYWLLVPGLKSQRNISNNALQSGFRLSTHRGFMGKSEIEDLSTTEAVRKRPAMYIGSTGYFGLIQYLVYPVATMLFEGARRISATTVSGMFQISSDIRLAVSDENGLIKPFQHIEGLDWHLYGCTVLNALSEALHVSIKTSQTSEDLSFARGKLVSRESTIGNQADVGTTITFKPDRKIFNILQVSPMIFESYFRRLSYLHAGVAFSLQLGENIQEFYTDNGILDLFTAISSPYQLMHEPIHIVGRKDSLKLEMVLAYHSWRDDKWWCYINHGRAAEGGTHEKGLFAGVARLKKRMGLHDDFPNGVLAVASIHYPDAVWEGCIKAKVKNPELRTMVSQLVLDEGLKWLEHHPDVKQQIPTITTFEFPDIWYK